MDTVNQHCFVKKPRVLLCTIMALCKDCTSTLSMGQHLGSSWKDFHSRRGKYTWSITSSNQYLLLAWKCIAQCWGFVIRDTTLLHRGCWGWLWSYLWRCLWHLNGQLGLTYIYSWHHVFNSPTIYPHSLNPLLLYHNYMLNPLFLAYQITGS